MSRRLLVAVALGAVGCGLDESGLLALDAGADSPPLEASVDAPADVQEEPVVCPDAGVASCTAAAAPGVPALFSPDAGAPCPAGYETHDLVLAAPDAPNCGCDCADAGTPSCDTTVANYHWGAGVCTYGSGTLTLSGSCTATNQTTFTGENLEIDPPAVTGGCAGGTSVAPPASTANVRLCVPECASDESVCAAQGALRACVSISGQTATCPAGYPSGPFYVGATPQVTCDGCSCAAMGDCTPSMAHLYGDGTCGAGDQGFPMDGVCHPVGGGAVGNFQSANVKPNLKGGTYQCKVTPGASHLTYVGESFTVCCK